MQSIVALVQPSRNSELFHLSLLKNTVVIAVTVYMSIAVRNKDAFRFVSLRVARVNIA